MQQFTGVVQTHCILRPCGTCTVFPQSDCWKVVTKYNRYLSVFWPDQINLFLLGFAGHISGKQKNSNFRVEGHTQPYPRLLKPGDKLLCTCMNICPIELKMALVIFRLKKSEQQQINLVWLCCAIFTAVHIARTFQCDNSNEHLWPDFTLRWQSGNMINTTPI